MHGLRTQDLTLPKRHLVLFSKSCIKSLIELAIVVIEALLVVVGRLLLRRTLLLWNHSRALITSPFRSKSGTSRSGHANKHTARLSNEMLIRLKAFYANLFLMSEF